ncbi:LysR family transcriptional regulator [Succinatimonas hippei]|uniref:LysR family transcriptional regulator n=1 Tax=Succinatimonas hippei TaxID=626938 RepID=UPI0026F17AF8|nr:LysR family transcriptional regulator [Succinatimonas hippei]
MDIRVLRYFIAVAETKSVTAAAEALHITQPTLSRQFKELEDELGKKLFDRGSRRITLTDAGELFYRRALMILELFNNTKAEISAENDEVSGTISIAMGESPVLNFLAHNLTELKQKYPKLKFNIVSCNDDTVRYLLKNEVCDFGVMISASEIGLNEYSYLTLPLKNSWGVLVRPESPLYDKECVTPDDLKKVPLLFSTQSLRNEEFRSWLNAPTSKLNIVCTYNLPQNAYMLAEANLADMVCLKDCVNLKQNSHMKFIPLKPALEASGFLVWKEQRTPSKAAAKFIEHLRRVLNKE